MMISMAAVPRASSGNLAGLLGRLELRPSVQVVRAGWRAARRTLISLCLGALALIANPGSHAMSLRVYFAARAETFNLVEWEALHVAPQASAITADLVRPPLSDGANLQRIHDY